jgi:hypothetical protein
MINSAIQGADSELISERDQLASYCRWPRTGQFDRNLLVQYMI